MVIGIFEGSEIAVSDEKSIEEAVEQNIEVEVFAEGEDQGGAADANDGDKGYDSIAKGEYFKVAGEHAHVGHDNGDGIDDGEFADGEIRLS